MQDMLFWRFQPKASRISPKLQCGTLSISKRPARLSESPLWTSRGDEPIRITCSSEPFRVSSSHRSFTASGQPSTFWISSRTRTAPSLSRERALAWFHCWEIQMEVCSTGESAVA